MLCCYRSSHVPSIDSERPFYLLIQLWSCEWEWTQGYLTLPWWAHEEQRRDFRPRLRQECIYSQQRNNSLFIRVKIVHKHNSCAGLKQTLFSSTASALRPSSSPFFLSVTGGEDVSLKCVCHAAALRWLFPQQKSCICRTHVLLSAAHLDLTYHTEHAAQDILQCSDTTSTLREFKNSLKRMSDVKAQGMRYIRNLCNSQYAAV